MIWVFKQNGEKAPFEKSKIIQSCMRAGAPYKIAVEIANDVEKRIYNGISTKEISRMVREELKKRNLKKVYIKYPLQDALALLDPNTYEFEHYITKLFRYMGYKAIRSPLPKPRGFCVDHEIDVVAWDTHNRINFIEVKHHFKERKYTHLSVIMYHHARLQDFIKAYKYGRFNYDGEPSKATVITNTKFTYHAIAYAKCNNIKLIGWNYPEGKGINHIIEQYKAYPLTLFGIKQPIREILFEKYGVIDARDLIKMDQNILRKYLKNKYSTIINKIKEALK